MLTLVPEKIERYAAGHSAPESAVFKSLVRETRARTRLPQMQVGRVEGAFLRLLARLVRARRALEIGTFTGYSSLALAEGLKPGGRLWTLDVDPEAAAIARRHWARSPHGRKITLRLGPALKTLKSLRGPFDLVFIDADKENYGRYWDACLPKVRKGGLLVADNTLWSGRVLKPREASARAIAAFNRKVAGDRRVEPVLLTVRDGMTLAIRR